MKEVGKREKGSEREREREREGRREQARGGGQREEARELLNGLVQGIAWSMPGLRLHGSRSLATRVTRKSKSS